MKLYFSPGACSLASHIALREAGIDVELVKVEGRGAKTAAGRDFAEVTTKAYVPALELNDGSVLTEGTAILPFIADQAPASGLAPAPGTMERYRLHEWLGYINSEIHKSFSPFFAPGSTDAQKEAAKALLDRRLRYAEEILAGRDFLLGDVFTVADAYLYTVLSWCRYVNIDLGTWPVLKDYHDRIAARPAVVEARKQEGLPR
jgi:glutathione S-transferase